MICWPILLQVFQVFQKWYVDQPSNSNCVCKYFRRIMLKLFRNVDFVYSCCKSFLFLHIYAYMTFEMLISQSYMNLSLFLFLSFFPLQSAWIAIQRSVEYKPLQFMSFVFMYIIFEKLKSFEALSSPTLTWVLIKFDALCLVSMHLVAVLTNIDVETGCRRKGQKMDGDWEWERGFFGLFH